MQTYKLKSQWQYQWQKSISMEMSKINGNINGKNLFQWQCQKSIAIYKVANLLHQLKIVIVIVIDIEFLSLLCIQIIPHEFLLIL
jgi:hypothetical protein